VIRTFIAIDLPDGLLDEIDVVTRQMQELGLDGRYPRREGLHLTLKFLGDIEEEAVPEISRMLQTKAGDTEPFKLCLEELGAFPNLRRPRVGWVGLSQSEPLRRLHQAVEDGLYELGFERERRSFHPHLTVVRLKSQRNLEGLVRLVESFSWDPEAHCFQVDRLHLYQSILKPDGARYRVLATVPFQSHHRATES
jgi:2'-5' RNA ligase